MSDQDNDGDTFHPTPGIADERLTFTGDPWHALLTGSVWSLDMAMPLTALGMSTPHPQRHIPEFHVSSYDVRAKDADGYSVIITRDLPPTITAHELAQIIDMTMRLPNYVIKRDFPGVAHLFKPVEEA